MTKEQQEEIEKALKIGQIVVNTRSIKIGADEIGLPTFEIQYLGAPKNYKLVRIIEPYNCAILEVLTATEE